MTRPQVVDTFMYHDEADVLELRLDTMAEAVDWFVLVQADVDHQNHAKPYRFDPADPRWSRWAHKIIDVRASGLPDTPHDEDPWAREWAQRDWTWTGLQRVPNLAPGDVVLHGDVDEIVRPEVARSVRPRARQFVSLVQTLYCFAVDWQHPEPWGGTVAVTVDTASQLGDRLYVNGQMYHPGAWQLVRNQRNGLIGPNFADLGGGWEVVPVWDAGWHFSWLGGRDEQLAKLERFCHPEITERVLPGMTADRFLREGWHTDGVKLLPVDVDESWPPYVYEFRCPESWWRPR
jgi:hypothetical protein